MRGSTQLFQRSSNFDDFAGKNYSFWNWVVLICPAMEITISKFWSIQLMFSVKNIKTFEFWIDGPFEVCKNEQPFLIWIYELVRLRERSQPRSPSRVFFLQLGRKRVHLIASFYVLLLLLAHVFTSWNIIAAITAKILARLVITRPASQRSLNLLQSSLL